MAPGGAVLSSDDYGSRVERRGGGHPVYSGGMKVPGLIGTAQRIGTGSMWCGRLRLPLGRRHAGGRVLTREDGMSDSLGEFFRRFDEALAKWEREQSAPSLVEVVREARHQQPKRCARCRLCLG